MYQQQQNQGLEPGAPQLNPRQQARHEARMQTYALRNTLQNRHVEFSTSKYLSEGYHFTKLNCCTFLKVFVLFALIAIGVHLAVFGLTYARYERVNQESNDVDSPMNQTSVGIHAQIHSAFSLLHGHGNDDADGPRRHHWRHGPRHHGLRHVNTAASNSGNGTSTEEGEEVEVPRGVEILAAVLFVLASVFIFTPLLSSSFAAVFKALRTNTYLKWQDFFSAFNCGYYPSLVRLAFVQGLLHFLLWHLWVIPGVIYSLMTVFVYPLHHEHRFLRACGAIKLSCKLVSKYCCHMLGFLLVLILINILGMLAFGVGTLFTVPLTFSALCFCYAHIVGLEGPAPASDPENNQQPAAPQPPQQQPVEIPSAMAGPVSSSTPPSAPAPISLQPIPVYYGQPAPPQPELAPYRPPSSAPTFAYQPPSSVATMHAYRPASAATVQPSYYPQLQIQSAPQPSYVIHPVYPQLQQQAPAAQPAQQQQQQQQQSARQQQQEALLAGVPDSASD